MAKRENESISIKELLDSFIKKGTLHKGMQKLKIGEAWNTIMGQGVASYTTGIQLQNKTLIVNLSSSVLREELSYGKEKIIKMINEEMSEEVVEKLLLV